MFYYALFNYQKERRKAYGNQSKTLTGLILLQKKEEEGEEHAETENQSQDGKSGCNSDCEPGAE